MPLSQPQPQATPGSSSNSRKRTHAEITRSESRSQSPQPPSKRRRTFPSPSQTRISSSPDSTAYSSDGVRFVGDGLDHRRPVMSTASTSQQQNQETIDLTLDDDDDSPPPHTPLAMNIQRTGSAYNNRIQSQPLSQSPAFNPQHDLLNQDVIDLSSDEDEDESGYLQGSRGGATFVPSSPEVQFIRERTLPRPPDANRNHGGRPQLPMPSAMRGPLGPLGPLTGMATFLRDMTSGMFGHIRSAHDIPDEALNRIDGLFHQAVVNERGAGATPHHTIDEYDGLHMDYQGAAFPVGNNFLLIDDPATRNNPANRRNESVYKAPPPAQKGFTRNYEEDDMLICGFCKDELATGTTDQKQQVWIIKQCGHAYCGDCAHGRAISKQKNNRDTKKIASKRTNDFKVCTVPGCTKAVNSKTKMFQIYL